jgi:polyhydroxybutyrate depolymerase
LAERVWNVDGVSRQALVYVPETATKAATPVVFSFHGHGGTMNYAAQKFAYHLLWPDALVVYMQGLPTPGRLTDPNGTKPGWQNRAGTQGDRDLHFFDAVLASLRHDYKVDERRIYATGHSNGGGFTYLLWSARGDVFAALAPAAAFAPTAAVMLQKPKPILHVAGEQDKLVKFEWQEMTMEAVRKLNGCSAEGIPWAKAGNIVATLYPSKTGTPFVSAIYPGPHQFPEGAAGLIVKFFKEQAKPQTVP